MARRRRQRRQQATTPEPQALKPAAPPGVHARNGVRRPLRLVRTGLGVGLQGGDLQSGLGTGPQPVGRLRARHPPALGCSRDLWRLRHQGRVWTQPARRRRVWPPHCFLGRHRQRLRQGHLQQRLRRLQAVGQNRLPGLHGAPLRGQAQVQAGRHRRQAFRPGAHQRRLQRHLRRRARALAPTPELRQHQPPPLQQGVPLQPARRSALQLAGAPNLAAPHTPPNAPVQP